MDDGELIINFAQQTAKKLSDQDEDRAAYLLLLHAMDYGDPNAKIREYANADEKIKAIKETRK